MTRPPELMSGGLGVAMTDLFISAGAAIVMVIALSRPTPRVELPPQADIIATCPEASTFQGGDGAIVMRRDAADTTSAVPVVSPEDLAATPATLGLPARLFYTIALEDTPNQPVSAACLRWVQNDLIRAHHRRLLERDPAYRTRRCVFSLAPVPVTLAAGEVVP